MTPGGEYFAALLLNDGKVSPQPPEDMNEDVVLGVDLGLSHLVTDSNGRHNEHQRVLSRNSANLRRKQKSRLRKRR